MNILSLLSTLLILSGLIFFLAGTVGMIRFPNAYSRLHALTKADNLGLGLVVFGLILRAPTVWIAAKLLLIWILALINSAFSCYLIANHLWRSIQANPSQGNRDDVS